MLREAAKRVGLLGRLASCFDDWWRPEWVEHTVAEMVAQRVYGLALGYEDLNDHEELRRDPLLQLMSGKREAEPLAGKSTLNRLELSREQPDRYKRIGFRQASFDALLLDIVVEAHPKRPARIVLDLDVTDLPLHGHQEGRFFHGYYDEYCYAAVRVGGRAFAVRAIAPSGPGCGRGSDDEVGADRGPAARRLAGSSDHRAGGLGLLPGGDHGLVRAAQSGLRAGGGAQPGPAPPDRGAMRRAKQEHAMTGRPARVFREFRHRTISGTWSRARRVVAKAERIQGKENPRFVVTSLEAESWPAPALYEQLYCARGEMENRIKEQLSLFATRVSAEAMRANQLRVNFAAAAYLLVHALRRLGLQGAELARAQATTIRLRLLKIGAEVRLTARRVWLRMSVAYPRQALFRQAWTQLRT